MTGHRYLVEIRYVPAGGGDRSWLVPTDDEPWVAELRAAAHDPAERHGTGIRWLNCDNEFRYVAWEDVLAIKVNES
ncbi:hypothetical protein AB0F72_08485 [Actinoplanes sp. NPDC023936]|uniref:hypothetical protein n=1 Tax=Actinoplanes sp. NPDC023936 TaxID=3154910 RepID=UPI003408EC41